MTIASTTISRNSNQSRRSPRSSIICIAPTPRASATKPKPSSGRGCCAGGVLGRKVSPPSRASEPIGMLMKNTQRQDKASVR